ncbi:MAG: hypothetical protein J6S67_16540 [Methanobrevibacter sp.]|nr:hypothetical protein [Methanobrevibacter sp.]
MIHVDWNTKVGGVDALISCHCEEELRANFKAFLGAIVEHPDLTLIFLEEFNIKAQELGEILEDLNNGKNNSSD